ncbi:MAG TPA: glycosyltransferase [Candidatus Aquilonibacter sp.]|nr:glycosyltransferase [Candidatus Aquilonibacter sp.]
MTRHFNSSLSHRPTRVLMFIQSLDLGGSEKQCVEMARLLSRNGFEVVVGCMRRTGPLLRKVAEAGLQIVEFPVGSLLRPRAIRQMLRLARYIRANGFDVVHANDVYANLFAIPAARLAGVPVIVSSQRDLSHGAFYTPLRRKILRGVQRMSTHLLVNSESIKSQLVEEERMDSESIHVVYNGIDVERYRLACNSPATRPFRIPAVPPDRLIAVVGNMHTEVKGHTELIAAASIVRRECPAVRFFLVGDGEMRRQFESRVRAAGLENNVLFLGHRADVPEILPCCEIGVLPSHAEGLPNAVMEYMAAGLAVVATPVGGIPELIENEMNGLLVAPKDPTALAHAILRLLREEPLRRELGRAARETVLSKCDFFGVLSRLKLMYQAASKSPVPVPHPSESVAAD